MRSHLFSIACAGIAACAGFGLGYGLHAKPKPSPSSLTLTLCPGDHLELSSDGFKDGAHFRKELRVHKLVGVGPSQVVGGEGERGADDQRQHWTLQLGQGPEGRVGVVLVER